MTLIVVILVAAGAALGLSGLSMILGRNGPDRTDPRAGAAFLAVGILLLVASRLVS
ncbi:hypothetical protein [Antarcticirhabdus aurantiaca]|uniref:Uncharacterized protein n=1 Tax=Antarcticirhabdus aurantiaca TaxID=2606717 RepID=A0ACD4NJD6_9HYPH|nr:hypothetical protein OXU80_18705 [Jeongeuplla avenae]